MIYVFARVALALAKLAIQPDMHPLSSLITPEVRSKISEKAWPVFASLSWALVMYIFRWHPESLVSSLKSSMDYMYVIYLFFFPFDWLLTYFVNRYVDSDHWDSFRNFLIHNK